MVTTITEPTNRDVLVLGNAYKYDQLNRLVRSISNKEAFDQSNYRWDHTDVRMYQNTFIYDANGNILQQYRADRGNSPIDDLSYTYELNRNRLTRVEDISVHPSIHVDDIDYSEYSYDEEGRLKTDLQEGITEIVWRVDGKVKAIIRDGVNPDQKNLTFTFGAAFGGDYDAMGERALLVKTERRQALVRRARGMNCQARVQIRF